MPVIGPRCHELRIQDENRTGRIVYRADASEILVMEVFAKATRTTPKNVIDNCKKRLRQWDEE
jgi:phage-related protein